MRSDLFQLNWRDISNGLLVAVISAVLVYIQQIIGDRGLARLALTSEDVKTIVSIALTTGLGYLVKNLFEDNEGKNKITGAIGKVFKK